MHDDNDDYDDNDENDDNDDNKDNDDNDDNDEGNARDDSLLQCVSILHRARHGGPGVIF